MTITVRERKLLWGLSGNRCAHCRQELIKTASDARSVVGDECHILSTNGPRSDPSLTPQQRDRYENLILLCKVHHKIVDDQEDAYTEQRLKQMKVEHERWVAKQFDNDWGGGRGALAPLRPALLIGRGTALEDLKGQLLKHALHAAGQMQVVTTMTGWPGVGKTSVAAALAHDPVLIDSFPDGVLWASLGQSPNLLWEIIAWGRALQIPDILEVQSVAEVSALLAAVLRDRRALLIVDDGHVAVERLCGNDVVQGERAFFGHFARRDHEEFMDLL
jgi:NB-ARC domain